MKVGCLARSASSDFVMLPQNDANPSCRSLRPKRGLRVKANGDETFVEEDEARDALIGISPPVSRAPTRTSGATDTKRLFSGTSAAAGCTANEDEIRAGRFGNDMLVQGLDEVTAKVVECEKKSALMFATVAARRPPSLPQPQAWCWLYRYGNLLLFQNEKGLTDGASRRARDSSLQWPPKGD